MDGIRNLHGNHRRALPLEWPAGERRPGRGSRDNRGLRRPITHGLSFLNGHITNQFCYFADCCYCPTCTALYGKRHGKGTIMPPKRAGEPALRKLAAFQAESLAGFLAKANRAIKKIRPDVALYCNAGSREEPYYRVGRNNRILINGMDLLAAEGGFVYWKLNDQPIWKGRSNAKYYQSEAELLLALVQPPIHGSGVWLSSFSWFAEKPAFRRVSELFHYFGANPDAYHRTHSLARVAIVWPEESLNFYGKPDV